MLTTTIVLPISRPDYLMQVFASLEYLICERENTNLLAIVDGDEQLYEKAKNFVTLSKFHRRLCVFRGKGEASPTSIKSRRARIATIHNETKEHLKNCDYVLLTEDDTLLLPTALHKLHKVYMDYPHAGLVTGTQLGRWGLPYMGIWTVDNIYTPNNIQSSEQKQGVHEIDACGMYALLTKKENYIKHDFKENFENILGPDFEFAITLKRQGYHNYANFDVYCPHLTPKGPVKAPKPAIVGYEKKYDKWWQVIKD